MARLWQYQARADVYLSLTASATPPSGWQTTAPEQMPGRRGRPATASWVIPEGQPAASVTPPVTGWQTTAPLLPARRRVAPAGGEQAAWRVSTAAAQLPQGWEVVLPPPARRRPSGYSGVSELPLVPPQLSSASFSTGLNVASTLSSAVTFIFPAPYRPSRPEDGDSEERRARPDEAT
jgi:hypothetical protein